MQVQKDLNWLWHPILFSQPQADLVRNRDCALNLLVVEKTGWGAIANSSPFELACVLPFRLHPFYRCHICWDCDGVVFGRFCIGP